MANEGLETTLQRVGPHMYSGRLMVRHKFSDTKMWCRFVEENGISTQFIILKDAVVQFSELEEYQVYTFDYEGNQVKDSKALNGNLNKYEVMVYKAVRKIVKSDFQFPSQVRYNFFDWDTLGDTPDGTFVDIMGRVMTDPYLDLTSPTVPKLKFDLAYQDKKVPVAFLGGKAKATFKQGDILLLGGICVKSWRYDRLLETGWLTMVEINPRKRKGVDLDNIGDEEPKKKAFKLSLPSDVCQVKDIEAYVFENFKTSQPPSSTTPKVRFVVTGTLTPLKETFFTEDPPLYGEPGQEKMMWKTQIQDATASMKVIVWDKACSDLFGVTGNKLREMWEDGYVHEEKREELLEKLSAKLSQKYRLVCSGGIWSDEGKGGIRSDEGKGDQVKKPPQVQVGVDNVEEVEE